MQKYCGKKITQTINGITFCDSCTVLKVDLAVPLIIITQIRHALVIQFLNLFDYFSCDIVYILFFFLISYILPDQGIAGMLFTVLYMLFLIIFCMFQRSYCFFLFLTFFNIYHFLCELFIVIENKK